MRIYRTAFILFCLLLGAWRSGSPPSNFSNGGGMMMNLSGTGDGPSVSNHNSPILNWVNAYGPIFIKQPGNVGQFLYTAFQNGALDPVTGELVAGNLTGIDHILYAFWTAAAPDAYDFMPKWWNGMQWTISWDCKVSSPCTTVTQSGSTGTGGTDLPTCTVSPCHFTLGLNPGLGFNFTVNNSNPFQNVKIYKTMYAANVARGEYWDPGFLQQVGVFGRLRVMDWMGENSNGAVSMSQLADASYHICQLCNFGGLGSSTTATIDNGSGGAGNIFTVITGTGGLQQWDLGMQVTGNLVTGSPVIIGSANINSGACTPACTGKGNSGTYAISGPPQLIASGATRFLGKSVVGTGYLSGTRGGIHPSLIVDLMRRTGADIHLSLPVTITDQMMTDMMTYFRYNAPTKNKIILEYGNETSLNLNGPVSTLGFAVYGNYTSGISFSGYRASQLMAIAQTVFGTKSYNVQAGNTTSRWEGVIATQIGTSVMQGWISGFNDWKTACGAPCAATVITDLFGEAVDAPYYTNNPTNAGVPTTNMINDSNACFASVGGSITASISGTTLTLTGGSITVGQGITGKGVPANTYVNVNNGAGSYTLNQSATVGSETMTTVPCATKYQFFSQQYSKAFMTGSNDYGLTISVGSYVNTLGGGIATDALTANSNGLEMSEYEGGEQMTPETADPIRDFALGFRYDAAGNDPNYTPALLESNRYQLLRNVKSRFSAQYVDNEGGQNFGALRYYGDSNPEWSAMVTENALGPYVDPTPPATWTVNYNSSTDRNFVQSGTPNLSCPLTVPTNGLAIVAIAWVTGTTITSVKLDSTTNFTQDDSHVGVPRSAAIYSVPVTAGTHSVDIVWSANTSFASCYAMSVSGLASSTVQSVPSSITSVVAKLPIVKGSFVVSITEVQAGTPNYLTNSTPSGVLGTTNMVEINCFNNPSPDPKCANQVSLSDMVYFSTGPPFTTGTIAPFVLSAGTGQAIAAAAYR